MTESRTKLCNFTKKNMLEVELSTIYTRRLEFEVGHSNQIQPLFFLPTSNQNYEQSRQKLGTFLEIKYFKD